MKVEVLYIKDTGHVLGAVARASRAADLEQIASAAPLVRRYVEGAGGTSPEVLAIDFPLPPSEVELASLELELAEGAAALFAPDEYEIKDGALSVLPETPEPELKLHGGSYRISDVGTSSEDRPYVIASAVTSGEAHAYSGAIPANAATYDTPHDIPGGSVLRLVLFVAGLRGVVVEP